MSESPQVTEETPTMEQPQAEQPQAESLSLDDLKREVFAPPQNDAEKAKIAEAIEKARKIAAANNLALDFNWKASDEKLPDGYCIAIVPVNQRREGVTVPIGVYIAGIPSPSLIRSTKAGPEWVDGVIMSYCVNKLANSVRPRGDESTGPGSVPFTVEDFITTQSRDQGLSLYRELGPKYVSALKELGLKVMNLTLLRQILSSASFASQQFPNISQDKWVNILNRMITEGEANGANLGMLQVWKDTRDTTELTAGDFNLDDLEELVG